MAVEKWDEESGQSILEFVILLPMLVGLVMLMIRVNTAIQMSIVDQKYARAHTLWLTFNSPVYPELALVNDHFRDKGYNQMVIGVSENPAPPAGETFNPEASTHFVARDKHSSGNGKGDAQEEPNLRSFVRIRNTVSICTPSHVVAAGSATQPVTHENLSRFVEGAGALAFDYCRSPLDE